MKRLAALALALAALACTCGEPEVPLDTDLPVAGPDEPVAGVPRGRKGRKARPPPDPAPGEPAEPAPPTVPGITYEGNDSWTVERRLVDRWEDDPESLGAKVEEHGKGWEIRGVGPQDDAYSLGARNGDVVKRINGMSLDTTTDLLLVWAELGDATELDVMLTRDGQNRVHHYRIVR